MKKILALILILFTLTACESTNTAEPSEMPDKAPAVTDIRDLPEDYGTYSEKDSAIADGVVVITNKETYNADKLESFLKNAADGKAAFVRTIAYTIEGDPIITDYEYDGEKYIMTHDNRRDNFSNNGFITTSYWPYLISDSNGDMYLSSWSDFYGDNVETQSVRSHSYQLSHVSDEIKQLFRAEYNDFTGQFISPDGKHHIALTSGSNKFTAAANSSHIDLILPDGPAPICVLWQDEKNALLAGEQEGTMLFLPVNTETGECGIWQEISFSDWDELRQEARTILENDNWFGPGTGTYQITEPLFAGFADITVSLQYRTVVLLSYSRHDLGIEAKLYFDWFTGDYLGQVGMLDGVPYDLESMPVEDKVFSIFSTELDSYNIELGRKDLSLFVQNPYPDDIHLSGWDIQRHSHNYWWAVTDLEGSIDTSLASVNDSGTTSVDISIELPFLNAGYYRLALYFTKDGKAYVSYCPFTVGSVSNFDPSDLPMSDREVIDDRGVGIDLLRNAVPDDEIIMYKVTAEDNSDEFHTGCGAYLEVLIDDTWCILPDRISGFDAVGMTIGGEEREVYESLTIIDYLLPLEEGHYRILKEGYFEIGHDVYIAGEFDVVDGSINNYEVSAPEGLTIEAVGASEPNPDGAVKRGWANYFQLDVAIINASDVAVIPDAMTALTKGPYDGTAHEHYRTLIPGDSFATKLQLVTADHNGNLIYADDSGLFNDDGSMNNGTYKMSRRVFFPDGRWCMVYGEFEVVGSELVKASP